MRQTETLPRPQLEAMHKTYSADRLTENKIRGAYRVRGKLYVCTGGCFGPNNRMEINADELIPLSLWTDETATYAMACARADSEDGWRGVGKFYQGIVVSNGGQKFVLAGREVRFTQAIGTTCTATKQRSLFDC